MNGVDTGTVLAGKYKLESLIGRGGMGSVWRAEHLGLSAPVAVKLLDMLGAMPTAEALQRFHREARAAANIRSPHVVQILDHGVDQATATPYIVMELMEGESLAGRLERLGRLSPAEVAHVFNHVARALLRAHEAGIVHRDLKPDNVFLVRNEDEVVAKVLDFGIAKANAHALGNDSATQTGAVMGTAYYMSPDQISGAKNIDLHTDLWAFGVMACECLTGLRPFDADTIGGLTLKICVAPIPLPSSLGPVPAGFDAWFARIVTRDRTHRFASAREAADALRLVLAGEGGAASRPPLDLAPTIAQSHQAPRSSTITTGAPIAVSAKSAEEAPFARRSKAPWVLGGLAVLGAAAGGLWLSQASSRDATGVTTPAQGASVASSHGLLPAEAASAPPPAAAEPRPQTLAPTLAAEPSSGVSAPADALAAKPPSPPTAKPRAIAAPKPRPPAAKPPAPQPVAPTPNPAPVRDVIDERH